MTRIGASTLGRVTGMVTSGTRDTKPPPKEPDWLQGEVWPELPLPGAADGDGDHGQNSVADGGLAAIASRSLQVVYIAPAIRSGWPWPSAMLIYPARKSSGSTSISREEKISPRLRPVSE
jgi:hypothetical protein